MIRRLTAAAGSLLADMRMYFGLSQAELAALLGLRRPLVAQAEAGTRTLPLTAWRRLRAVQAASQAAAILLPTPDLHPLRIRLAQCLAQAQQMQVRLTYELPPRAAAARARLGAATALPAALATAEAKDALPPRAREDQLAQLTLLLNGARAEWDERSGPVPAALLRARRAGLLAEADALTAELAALEAPADEAQPATRPK
ncbi:helix-turn-helix domain-containing protein [Hymenobacter terrenus]|uniref:helix-turn-helix domain-containing protein n=1 Tax=Hymenobacter terrenus TaxID=1629124 RepID=UPI000ADC7A3B|nr:helix-turn-helix transcriptional regulator [Hymenobacter terrenus]